LKEIKFERSLPLSVGTAEKIHLLFEIFKIEVLCTGIIITAVSMDMEINVGLESTLGAPESL